MAGSVVLSAASVPVVPGEWATSSIRIRNTGGVVDSFTITVLGEAASWTTVTPPVVSLFPGDEGTAELRFAPPRSSKLRAGQLPFGVRVTAAEDPEGSTVEEGTLDLRPYSELAAKITPRTSETKRTARHQVVLENLGNAPVRAALEAADPDLQLAFDLRPTSLTIAPGETGRAAVKVVARDGFARGAPRHRPFQVTINRSTGDPVIVLDATLVQKAGLPRFVFPLAAGIVALALLVVAMPNRDSGDSATVRISSDAAGTTTTAAAPSSTEAPKAEPGGGAKPPGGGGGGGRAPKPAGGAPATTAAPAGAGGPTAPPATDAPPTTQPAATTTTVPSKTAAIRATMRFDFDAGVETSSGADMHWDVRSATQRLFTPVNGAERSIMGAVDYEAVTLEDLKSRLYSSASIDASDGNNRMPDGTVIAIRTSSGRYAKVRVESREPAPANTLHIRFFTYPAD